jgi:TonB family protein
MMNDVLTYLWEGSICLALTVGFYKVFFEKLTFFQWNRFMLLILLVAAALIPVLTFDLAPSMTVLPEVLLPVFSVGGQIESGSMVSTSNFSWQEILFFAYLIGVVIASSKFIWGTLKLWIQLKSASFQVYNGNKLVIHPRFEPASFFGYIMLPRFDPSDADHQLILLHESVHCSQKHTWDLVLVQLLKVFFWFNPFIFMYERLIREVHEFQADHFVTRFHSELAYSKLLLRLVTKSNSNQLVHSFNQFQTKKRIIMMTQTNTKPIQKARFILALPLLALFIAVFSCESSANSKGEFPESVDIPNTSTQSASDTVLVDLGKDGKEVFDVTEIQPSPAGGMEGWMKYLAESLQYPEEAKKQGIEGTVIMTFIINSDGTISDVETLRGVGGGCEEEAMRVIQNAPNWTPAQNGGKPVNCRMRLPLKFKLPEAV